MISNKVRKIDGDIVEVPVIIRSDEDGWIPTFDTWTTKIYGDTSYIDCTQNFSSILKNYATTEINSRIGHYDDDNLIIHWRILVDSADLGVINEAYRGKLRATNWKKRYCAYIGTGSNSPWLHTVIVGNGEEGYVTHHINCVSLDNRHQNLHILPKREHDGLGQTGHPDIAERKLMFADPQGYWQARKALAVDAFIKELAAFVNQDGKNRFIAKFAEGNMALTKEILETARYYINLSSVKDRPTSNRILNPHLTSDYLDTYEMRKYLKKHVNKTKTEGQLQWY